MDDSITRDRTRIGTRGWLALALVCAGSFGIGLGSSCRLSYHEAISGQTAREMLSSGQWLVPTIGGRPWLEKPPLAIWTIAALGELAGAIDETLARMPSAVAAGLIVALIAAWSARRYGRDVGWLAGAIQATTVWLVMRGRLAEADVMLAAVTTGAFVSFDRLRGPSSGGQVFRAVFFLLLGAASLLKGIGFGAVLLCASVCIVLAWDRDTKALRSLAWPLGWIGCIAISLAWPLAVATRHPEAIGLWTTHIIGRLGAKSTAFASESWVDYLAAPLWQTLPWTPFALVGPRHSWRNAKLERFGGDRLLFAWAIVPFVLVSLASVRNAHYIIYSLTPWSVWSALGLRRIAEVVRSRGWRFDPRRSTVAAAFAILGLCIGVGYLAAARRFHPREDEWAFYSSVGTRLPPCEPLVLLYDDWDKAPYPTPFGPVPADLAARLFYLGRSATCRANGNELIAARPASDFHLIARERDLPPLRDLGAIELIDRGPTHRWDRTFILTRVRAPEKGTEQIIGKTRFTEHLTLKKRGSPRNAK